MGVEALQSINWIDDNYLVHLTVSRVETSGTRRGVSLTMLDRVTTIKYSHQSSLRAAIEVGSIAPTDSPTESY